MPAEAGPGAVRGCFEDEVWTLIPSRTGLCARGSARAVAEREIKGRDARSRSRRPAAFTAPFMCSRPGGGPAPAASTPCVPAQAASTSCFLCSRPRALSPGSLVQRRSGSVIINQPSSAYQRGPGGEGTSLKLKTPRTRTNVSLIKKPAQHCDWKPEDGLRAPPGAKRAPCRAARIRRSGHPLPGPSAANDSDDESHDVPCQAERARCRSRHPHPHPPRKGPCAHRLGAHRAIRIALFGGRGRATRGPSLRSRAQAPRRRTE